MENRGKLKIDIRKTVYLAMLTALVVVLQSVVAPLIGAATGLSPALVLVPFVLGAVVCGLGAGVWLGAVFGIIVLLTDPTCAPFFGHNLVMTIVLVLAKGIGAGIASGLVFKLFSKKNKMLAVVLAGITAPIVNTGIFVVGCWLFFLEITGFEIYVLFTQVNFFIELAVNIVLVPAIYKILQIVKIA